MSGFSNMLYVLLGRFGNDNLVQARRQFVTMHSSCVFSKTDVLHVQHRVAPKSETSGWIKCILENIETFGEKGNKTTNSWEQAWTKLYQALGTSSDPCPLLATQDLTNVTSRWTWRLLEMIKHSTCHTHGCVSCIIESPSPACDYHTFSAFWLWPSVAVICY